MSAQETEGLPPSYVERLGTAKSGVRIVTTKYPDYYPFMENAKSGEARRRLLAMDPPGYRLAGGWA